jgi:hypothetical protein
VTQSVTYGIEDVFAPGHVGELTQVIPTELVDAVLDETGTREQRLRSLPSRVGVYFVLALGLFEHLGAGLVWGKLVAGLTAAVPQTSEKALRDLRRRIGVAPFQRLFEVLAGPLAQPSTPRSALPPLADGRLRRLWELERPRPRAQPVLARPHGAPLRPFRLPPADADDLVRDRHSRPDRRRLRHRLEGRNRLRTRPGQPLDLGHAAVGGPRLRQQQTARRHRGQGAQFLIRATSTRRPPVLALLPDGSYLTRIGSVRLRVIEAEVRSRTGSGDDFGGAYRLLTTLIDHRTDPADRLVNLYHERWEIEIAYLALRHTLLRGRVLRSKDPVGLTQEMWGLLTIYQALRSTMVTAVETVPGCDPDRAGFTVALEAARDTVVSVAGTTSASSGRPDLVGRIGTRVLRALMPERRMRLSARIVKCGTSRYAIWNRDGRPRDGTPITAIVITVHPPAIPTMHAPDQATSGRWGQVCRILAENSNQAMHARDIAGKLGLTSTGRVLSGFNAQLYYWARNGRLIRTAPSTYKIPLPKGLDTVN